MTTHPKTRLEEIKEKMRELQDENVMLRRIVQAADTLAHVTVIQSHNAKYFQQFNEAYREWRELCRKKQE